MRRSIRFSALGALDVRDERDQVVRGVVAQPRRTALLAYLAVARPYGFHRRDTLIALFWPESSERAARDLLNTHLSRMRAALGADMLVSRGNEEISIDADRLWSDVRAFEAAVDANAPEEALELYRGDLLEGFHISDAPDFERWLDDQRERLRALAVIAALDAAQARLGAGDLGAARRFAERGVALSRDNERSLRRAISLFDNMGDRADALRLYEDFANRLRLEFESEPSPETQQLIDRVRRRTRPSGSVAVVEAARSSPASAMPAVADQNGSSAAATVPARRRSRVRGAGWIAAAMALVVVGAAAPRWVAAGGTTASADNGATGPFIILGSGTHTAAGRDRSNRLVACKGPSCPAGSLPQDAYVVAPNGSYAAPAAGTNYIAPIGDGTSAPPPGYKCCTTATFENTFRLPPNATSASITLAVSADNQAAVSINGVEFARQRDSLATSNYADPTRSSTTFVPDPSGLNVLRVTLWDGGGALGLEYVATVTYETAGSSRR